MEGLTVSAPRVAPVVLLLISYENEEKDWDVTATNGSYSLSFVTLSFKHVFESCQIRLIFI
jgi:hypothetical protein